jgi:hypothetical protein
MFRAIHGSLMWSRLTTRSIRAINAVHRRALILKRQAPRALSSAAPYAIGIPLMVAVPAGGILLGLRLAHDPKFAAGKGPLIDPLITAGFFVVGVFFSAVRMFGFLPALGIATFMVLAVFLLCARLVGALAITAVRGEVADLDMRALLRR